MRVLLDENLNWRLVRIISARSNKLQDIQPVMLEVNQVLRDVQPGQVIHVNADVS